MDSTDKPGRRKIFRIVIAVFQGIDSLVSGGILRQEDGKLLALSFDGCIAGRGFSMLRQRVSVSPCPQPYHLYVNPKGCVDCFQPQLSYPANISSPNSEPY